MGQKGILFLSLAFLPSYSEEKQFSSNRPVTFVAWHPTPWSDWWTELSLIRNCFTSIWREELLTDLSACLMFCHVLSEISAWCLFYVVANFVPPSFLSSILGFWRCMILILFSPLGYFSSQIVWSCLGTSRIISVIFLGKLLSAYGLNSSVSSWSEFKDKMLKLLFLGFWMAVWE